MRNLIRLIESAQALVTAEGMEQWLAHQNQTREALMGLPRNSPEWVRAHSLFGEGDFGHMTEMLEEWGIDNLVAEVNKQFGAMPDPLPAYRGLHIDYNDPEQIPHMLRDPLGVSWTWEFGVAINENGVEGSYGRHNSQKGEFTNVVLEAAVPKSCVDWNYTAALTIAEFDEPELRLIPNQPVTLKAIHLLDDYNWEKYSHHEIVSGTGDFSPYSRERVVKTIEVGKTYRA
jgi:hypothetical protein